MKKVILVTGGAGFIGSVCTEILLERGYRVVVIDNLNTGHIKAVEKRAIFIKGDIGNENLLRKLFKKYKFEAVIHFAAETLVNNAVAHPDWYHVNNLQKGISLLEALRNSSCRRIIFSSSAAVYGNPKSFPIKESDETNPLNAYGYTKLVFENILKDYSKAFGINFIIFRYFNPAGATKKHGEMHNPETHLIPLLMQAIKNNKQISVYGDDYDTKDGTCIRDYLHVVDVAEAHILALKDINRHPNAIYNLGSAKGFSVKEVIGAVEKVTGKKVITRIASRRAGDPAKLVASNKKAIKDLHWKPKFGDLQTIIKTAWEFEQRLPSKN
jgi:UDP-glucose 4-epimerase